MNTKEREGRPRGARAILLGVAIVVALGGCLAAYFAYGEYDVAADEPHWAATERALEWVRMRSIERRAASSGDPPDLAGPDLIAIGAGQYAEMCVECHLAPGRKESTLRDGLYPKPPDLSLRKLEPRAAFWVVKHGIKMTAMPAWGASHDDATIWSLVAFLQKLSALDAKSYETMVQQAPADKAMEKMPPMKHGSKPHDHKR